MKAFARSGQTQRRWCEQEGVALATFGYWRRKLRGVEQPVEAPGVWAPVQISPGAPVLDGGVTVRIGPLSVEVTPGFDPATLRAVVRALEAPPC